MISKILNILSDGNYHNGNSLGLALNVSRSAIWKYIKKLQQYGINITSRKGKGYILNEPLILLNTEKIRSSLKNNNIKLHLFESLDSTNYYLRKLKKDSKIHICLAEHQTQGKGRFQRTWFSPFGKNIYLSCLYHFQKDMSELAGLSLLVSLAIVKTLKHYDISSNLLGVKWSNDVMYDQHKLSGNLIEIQAETHDVTHAIIGIGINVNMLESTSAINQDWISLRKILNTYIDRNILCIHLINNLLEYLAAFSHTGFASFIAEWEAHDSLLHKTIILKNIQEQIKGTVTGINEQGYLKLLMSDGVTRTFSSGETSIVR